MAAPTAAQEEFNNLIAPKHNLGGSIHAEDREEEARSRSQEREEEDEEAAHARKQVDAAMRMPAFDRRAGGGGGSLRLPDRSFDNGGRTGVKGVIADARSYEEARRRGKSGNRINGKSKTITSTPAATLSPPTANGGRVGREERSRKGMSYFQSDSEGDDDVEALDTLEDDEEFLEMWRESRKAEIEKEVGRGRDVRTRRTSPSVRRYGRLDEVDMLGYLDAIEKVGRETVVVVFVYDPECPISALIHSALLPLVPAHPAIHFVKVSYDQMEFDPAGTPAILAYRNQGDLFANLTYIVDYLSEEALEDGTVDEGAFKALFVKHGIL